MQLTRRRLLILSALSVGLVPFAGCVEQSDDANAGAGSGSGEGSGSGDGSGSGEGSGSVAATHLRMKGPWVMVTGATQVRLRCETNTDAPLTVTLRAPDGTEVVGTTEQETRELAPDWPRRGIRSDHPDKAGPSTLHDITLSDLTPGLQYSYTLTAAQFETASGTFRAPPAPGEEVRVLFVADTMWPGSEKVGPVVAALGGDLFLHGGDIQYYENPVDTWNGYFAYFGGVMASMAAHHAIGNHEYEAFGEFESHFERLFGGQGEPTGTVDYHAFTFGSARFVFLNSEADFGPTGTTQMAWFEEELRAADGDPAIRTVIVVFHRPVYTFGKSNPDFTVRDYFHPRFLASKVRLVLTGHNHGYERFLVDGIHYVVDAGGGALLTNINDTRAEVLAVYPDEESKRLVASSSYGVSAITIAGDGSIRVERVTERGVVTDSYTVSAP